MNKDALLKVIADRLVSLRIASGKISQRELARQTNLSPGTINRIENCKEFPQKDTLRILSRFFGTDDLLQKHDPKAIPLSDLPPEVRESVKRYDVIQGPPGITIYVNPETPLPQRRMVLEMAAEMQRKVRENKGRE